ncbi:MAG: hypothetical protein PHU97_08310 [Bacteroidales bacterium]|nr:hypothetical protein [Bacteroidales bacterium]MDD2322131.1 hypothetical protein [Bacteroidales bacterium]MDD3011305.1 hypothetical protein [Bacteroidales bacterium]MDD3961401.1 hypothetical protein [Bacteroidales bacterium]MDY0284863.1 hypothetical protein [Bacteroidales bacterium]
MTNRFSLFLMLLVFSVIQVFFISCGKTDPDSIPSYIAVDTSFLQSQSALTGSSSHRIVDVWLYADEQLIGAFETPVMIPVLEEGNVKLRFKPGIMANGIGESRQAYSFLSPYEITARLTRDSVVIINPVYTYKDNVQMVWIEDFEDLSANLKKSAKSDTSVLITTSPGEVFEGSASGKIVLTKEPSRQFFEVLSDTSYVLPQDGSTIVLEMNYKTETVFTVGVFVNTSTTMTQVSVLNLNATDTWKKVYIYLTTAVNTNSSALDYSIFFGGFIDEEASQSVVYLDNLKLLF